MARRAYRLRNRRRGAGNGDAEVEEVTVVKVAVKVELDIALCMDSRGRLREGGKECSLLAGRQNALEGVRERRDRSRKMVAANTASSLQQKSHYIESLLTRDRWVLK